MVRPVLTVAFSVSASVAIGTLFPSGPLAQQSTFRSRTDLVIVDVSVQANGQPVSGLTASDFRLTDNGIDQDVQLAAAAEIPLDLLVVDDDSGLVDGRDTRSKFLGDIQSASALLKAGDRLGVFSTSPTGRVLLPLTAVPVTIPADSQWGGWARINDAVAQALLTPGEPGRRRHVLVQTNGADLTSATNPSSVPVLAARSDAVLDVAFSASIPSGTHDNLVAASALTGGRTFATTNLLASFQQMLDAIAHLYTLTYVPKGQLSPGWHAINVTVTKPGQFTIGSRRGYMNQQR